MIFGLYFNQPMDGVELPRGLQNLTFGHYFNQSLQGLVFPNLTTLTFGNWYNVSLEGVKLPNSLKILTFENHFNQPLDRVALPSSLEILTFGDQFDQSLEHSKLPACLQHLTCLGAKMLRCIGYRGIEPCLHNVYIILMLYMFMIISMNDSYMIHKGLHVELCNLALVTCMYGLTLFNMNIERERFYIYNLQYIDEYPKKKLYSLYERLPKLLITKFR